MARTFGDEKKEDKDQHDGGGGSGDGDGNKDQWSAKGACGGIDENDAQQQQSQEDEQGLREDAEEGTHLYLDFIRTEIQRSGLRLFDQSLSVFDEDEIPSDRLTHWTRAGRELRLIADNFSRSKEREIVLNRAKDIELESLNCEHFFKLLQELFQGEGVTRERILVLFFFCADLAIEALKKGFASTFNQLMQWSLRYIATRVAEWVHSNGGWAVVLRSTLAIAYQVTAVFAFVAVVAACCVYIRRNN